MADVKDLGVVVIVHESGIVETDNGIRSSIKAKIGDSLVQDTATGQVSIVVEEKDTKKELVIDKALYENLNIEGLADKFSLSELKVIAKQEGRTEFSKLNKEQLAYYIVENKKFNDGAD